MRNKATFNWVDASYSLMAATACARQKALDRCCVPWPITTRQYAHTTHLYIYKYCAQNGSSGGMNITGYHRYGWISTCDARADIDEASFWSYCENVRFCFHFLWLGAFWRWWRHSQLGGRGEVVSRTRGGWRWKNRTYATPCDGSSNSKTARTKGGNVAFVVVHSGLLTQSLPWLSSWSWVISLSFLLSYSGKLSSLLALSRQRCYSCVALHSSDFPDLK